MKRYKIKNKNGKVIAEIFSFMDESKKTYDEGELINSILKQIKSNYKIGYAGFRTREGLKYNLKHYNIKPIYKKVNQKDINRLIEQTIKRFYELFKRRTYIFLFPTKDKFILKRMNGVSGINPWRDTVLIYLNPTTKKWQRELKEIIAHEFAHVFEEAYKRETLLDGLIADGKAEHFREYFVGGKRAPWTKAFSRKKAIKLVKELKNKFNSRNWRLYREVFYGTGKYSMWAGYTIGYYIVEEYLKKQKKIDWKKIIKTQPKEILKVFEENLKK